MNETFSDAITIAQIKEQKLFDSAYDAQWQSVYDQEINNGCDDGTATEIANREAWNAGMLALKQFRAALAAPEPDDKPQGEMLDCQVFTFGPDGFSFSKRLAQWQRWHPKGQTFQAFMDACRHAAESEFPGTPISIRYEPIA